MITIPTLSDVTDILDTDLVMVTNSQGQSYKIAGSELNKRGKIIIADSTTITGAPLKVGSSVRVYFTVDLTAANASTTLQLNYNGVNYYVKAPKDGTLINFVATNLGGSPAVYKYLQKYTTLELLFDGTQFVIIGNPIVISSAEYSIYADGKVDYTNKLILEKTVTCSVGNTTIELKGFNGYLIVASGNNYGRGVWFITQGYNGATTITPIYATSLNITSDSFKQIKVVNTGGGEIDIKIYKIQY